MKKCKYCREAIRSDNALNTWIHSDSGLRACVGNAHAAWPKQCPGYEEECGVPLSTEDTDLCPDCFSARLNNPSARITQ